MEHIFLAHFITYGTCVYLFYTLMYGTCFLAHFRGSNIDRPTSSGNNRSVPSCGGATQLFHRVDAGLLLRISVDICTWWNPYLVVPEQKLGFHIMTCFLDHFLFLLRCMMISIIKHVISVCCFHLLCLCISIFNYYAYLCCAILTKPVAVWLVLMNHWLLSVLSASWHITQHRSL